MFRTPSSTARTIALALPVFAPLASNSSAQERRSLTNMEGKIIEAEILEYKDGVVRIRSNGKTFRISDRTLSEADRSWLQSFGDGGAETRETQYEEVVFKDDFSEGYSGTWKRYKSESIVADGFLIGRAFEIRDHAAVDIVPFNDSKDVELSLRFRFVDPNLTRFRVWLDDRRYKGSHAGHICGIRISPKWVVINDGKTGEMSNAIFALRKTPEKLSADQKALLESTEIQFPLNLDDPIGSWHTLRIRTDEDKATVWIDGKEIGGHSSPGFAHVTKNKLLVVTPGREIHFDDVVLRRRVR